MGHWVPPQGKHLGNQRVTETLGTHLGTGFAPGEISEGIRSLLVAVTGCPAGFLSMVCPRAWSKFVAIAKEKAGGTSPHPGKG